MKKTVKMEKFRTTFIIPEHLNKIDYQSKVISLGSCFSENIGEKLTYYKFPVLINPFGILYNPESIANSLDFLQSQKSFNESDLFEHNGVWNSFYHHSRFSNTDKSICLNQINKSLKKASETLAEANFLLITFGTSWVYQLKSSGNIVSNCHKIPTKQFKRFKLSVAEITKRYKTIIKTLQSNNPNLKIVFTVSPVRHLKDSAEQNQLSKATLIMAVHELVEIFENVSYFPSYEIMMDDLRDYRFYNEDMVHPSPTAVNYIWDKFQESYINTDSQKLMTEVDKINQALNHRPFQPDSDSHKKFLESTLSKIEKFKNGNSNIDFTNEKKMLLDKLR